MLHTRRALLPSFCRSCSSPLPAARWRPLTSAPRSRPNGARPTISSTGGRIEVRNVNGKIEVLPSDGRTVEVVAVKTARGPSADAAREALGRIEIVEDVRPDAIRLETKLPRASGFFQNSGEVRYTVRVPASAATEVITVNGGVEVTGLSGRVRAETTNGGIVGRDMSGALEASTTNGGIDVEMARVADGGVRLDCTNGGIKVRLPGDAGRRSPRASRTAASTLTGSSSKQRNRAAAASKRG